MFDRRQHHVHIFNVSPRLDYGARKSSIVSYRFIFLKLSRNQSTLLEIPIGFSVAMSCVLTNRIILNVREVNKTMNRVSSTPYQVIIGEDGSRTTLNDVEMAQLRALRSQPQRIFGILSWWCNRVAYTSTGWTSPKAEEKYQSNNDPLLTEICQTKICYTGTSLEDILMVLFDPLCTQIPPTRGRMQDGQPPKTF
jgi:hypothetical protein